MKTVGLSPPSCWYETSNSGTSKQGTGPWVCPMQSCKLRGISSLVPLQLCMHLSTNQEPDETALQRLPCSQVTNVLGWLLRYQPLTNKKMPVLGNQPLGSPSAAQWVISEDRVQERQTKRPVTFFLGGAERGAGGKFELSVHGSPAQASCLVTHLQRTGRLQGSSRLQQFPSNS